MNPTLHRFTTHLAIALGWFLGSLGLLNLLGTLLHPHFDATIWWLDLRLLPHPLPLLFLLLTCPALLTIHRRPTRMRTAALLLLLTAALFNTTIFYLTWHRHLITPTTPIPLSLLLALAFAFLLLPHSAFHIPPSRPHLPLIALLIMILTLLTPLLLMLSFGTTDYRRPADAAVVFGARVNPDGSPSQALADRVRTACQLYHDGLVQNLVMSGGPGPNLISEPQAMRTLALSLGVPSNHILLDPLGLNTTATTTNLAALARTHHWTTLLAVSHAYHLPRVKLAMDRANLTCFTVPAHQTAPMVVMPKLITREILADWFYWAKG